MNPSAFFIVFLASVFAVTNACQPKCKICTDYPKINKAEAVFYSGISVSQNVSGTITFTNLASGGTTIAGTLTGLPAGKHGFHIHVYGNFTSCSAGGGHYNPASKTHGGPTATTRHVGDLGNIDGGASTVVSMTDKEVTLNGPTSVIGRMLVIHQNPDDLGLGGAADSKTTGNAGPRIACSIIGIAG